MNLRNIFRRTRPTPPAHRLDPHEARIISAWGFAEAEWSALPAWKRNGYRTNYLKAPGYIR